MSLNSDALALVALSIVSLGALILLISHDWRLSVSALGVVYVGAFILVGFSWPTEMAVVKLVAGWISASVLGMGTPMDPALRTPSNGFAWVMGDASVRP